MEERSEGQLISLVAILNIIWRRRLLVFLPPLLGLVVGVLYGIFGTRRWSATASVRPGITSYTPEGFPIRQWQLKDITTWYDKQLYGEELNRRLGLPEEYNAVIQTEFIAAGLTNLAGGEVVTLWTTGTAPELAKAIIDTSIALFREYAEGNSYTSAIQLTREGLLLQIQTLEKHYASVDKKELKLDLELNLARADSMQASILDDEIAIDLEKMKKRMVYYQNRIEDLDRRKPDIERDLDQLNEVMATVVDNKDSPIDPESVPGWARRDAVLDGGDVLDGLGELRLRIRRKLERHATVRDSFAWELDNVQLEIDKQSLKRTSQVLTRRREIERTLGELLVTKRFVLPVERQEVRTDINSRQVQLRSLTSLQQVGKTIVSDKPVRPRGPRAIIILVFLGMIGGLILGFSWDFLSGHRRQIFARSE